MMVCFLITLPGSGKTHTMLGPNGGKPSCLDEGHADFADRLALPSPQRPVPPAQSCCMPGPGSYSQASRVSGRDGHGKGGFNFVGVGWGATGVELMSYDLRIRLSATMNSSAKAGGRRKRGGGGGAGHRYQTIFGGSKMLGQSFTQCLFWTASLC